MDSTQSSLILIINYTFRLSWLKMSTVDIYTVHVYIVGSIFNATMLVKKHSFIDFLVFELGNSLFKWLNIRFIFI